jgi:hypothetical protein
MGTNNSIASDNIFQTSDDLAWRDVNNEMVVLNIHSGKYITFNNIGREIWLKITEGNKIAEIVDDIVKDYNIDREKVTEDVKEFIGDLVQKKVLKLKT